MTQKEFLHVKNLFDQGSIPIQNANLDAFLFDNKWYPLRSFVNKVDNRNNHRSIKDLVLLIPFLRIKEDVSFHGSNNFPIGITNEEKIKELKLVMDRINNILC